MPAGLTTTTEATSAGASRVISHANSSSTSGTASRPGGFRRFWRALKQLFHEITGAVFAILAFTWLSNAFRAWTRDVSHWLIALAVLVAAIFTFFAVSSFRRARKL